MLNKQTLENELDRAAVIITGNAKHVLPAAKRLLPHDEYKQFAADVAHIISVQEPLELLDVVPRANATTQRLLRMLERERDRRTKR